VLARIGLTRQVVHAVSEFPLVDWLLRKRAEDIVEKTGIVGNLRRGWKVLSIGSGKCHIEERTEADMGTKWEPVRIVCIDNRDWAGRQVLQRAWARYDGTEYRGIEFRTADAKILPFPAKSFDAVASFWVLHEMSDDDIARALQEAVRVLKKNPHSRIFIAEDMMSLESRAAVYDRILNLRGSGAIYNFKNHLEWKDIFNNAGLEIVKVKPFSNESWLGLIYQGFYTLRLKAELINH